MKAIELAETWEAWAKTACRLAEHADLTTAIALRAKAEQAIDDATALRNLTDQKEDG
jgi:hypothetical protein